MVERCGGGAVAVRDGERGWGWYVCMYVYTRQWE